MGGSGILSGWFAVKKLGGSGNIGWENGKPGSGTESSPGITLMPENVTLVDMTDCGQRRWRFWDECPFSGQVIIAGMFAVSKKGEVASGTCLALTHNDPLCW